jgi:uncharacterized protein (TIGR03435 family)
MTGSTSGVTFEGSAVSLPAFVGALQGQTGRPIVDKTDLKGLFDIYLEFNEQLTLESDAPPSEASAPSLFTAIQTLGLKLEAAKAPREVVVIDSIQKPVEN